MAKVIVLGSSGFDLTIRLARLPRPGETLLGGTLHTGPGGKGANQAIAARRAGGEVVFLTAFGGDDFGRRAEANARAEGLDLRFARTVASIANQVALILVGDDGQNLIGAAPGASGALRPEDVDALPASVFDPSATFLASLEVPIETVLRGLERAKAAGLRTILNPAPADRAACRPELLRLVDVLTPNEEELAHLADDDADLGIAAAARLLRSRGAGAVLVTLGEAGVLVVAGIETPIPAPRVEVRDTVGAGDAFNGALAVALAEGRTLEQAARWACVAGSLAVTADGAQGALPDRAAIDRIALA